MLSTKGDLCRLMSRCVLRDGLRGLRTQCPPASRLPSIANTQSTSSLPSSTDCLFQNAHLHERNYVLPSIDRPSIVYTFPMLERAAVAEPMPMRNEVEEPTDISKPTIEAPAHSIIEKSVHRMHKVRKRKMKVHKRRKRAKLNRVKNMKWQAFIIQRSETAWRGEMNVIIEEMRAFNAETYVKEILQKVDEVESSQSTETTSEKRYPHWTELVTIEELYGLPVDDYIDKRAGYANGEESKEIAEKKKIYYQDYYLKKKNY